MRFSKLDALSALRDDRTLDAKERLVSVMLTSHADAAGEAFPSLDRLALETGLARSTVVLALARLKARGDAAPVRVRSEARGNVGKDGGRPPNKYRLSITNSVRPPDGSPPSAAGEFRPIGEGVSSDSQGGFRPAVGLEAGQGSCTKKLEGEGAARHRRSSTSPKQISESWGPTEKQIAALSELHNVSAKRIASEVAEFRGYWQARGDKKNAVDWYLTFRGRIADLVKRGELPRNGERTHARTSADEKIPSTPEEAREVMDLCLGRAAGGGR